MLVLLDRDGVINEDRVDSVTTQEQFVFIDGAIEAIESLNDAGIYVAVVTNQSAVGKGLMTQETLDSIHLNMCREIEKYDGYVDAVYACTDHPDHPTHRRKPAPGMIEEALDEFEAKAKDTPFVGDALRDLQAAHAAGCPRYLVKTGKGQQTIEQGWDASLEPVIICDSISDAVEKILKKYGE